MSTNIMIKVLLIASPPAGRTENKIINIRIACQAKPISLNLCTSRDKEGTKIKKATTKLTINTGTILGSVNGMDDVIKAEKTPAKTPMTNSRINHFRKNNRLALP
jgi:hypothetical protein